MPAVRPDNILTLPRVMPRPHEDAVDRPVVTVVTAPRMLEGEGFEVRRAFSGLDLRLTDPFLMLDHLGAVEYSPGEAKGAPDHPHRGFETVTYMMDGELEHRDSNGGGGLITDGATQWMTAGAGIVHSEMPTERIFTKGGLFHGTQLWVNLPKALKWTPPQYQDVDANRVKLLASEDGGALIRLIAGDLGGHSGPGATRTPITYAHVSVSAGARLQLPWKPDFNALVYILAGYGTVGDERRPIREGQTVALGKGNQITLHADAVQDARSNTVEALVLGGLPIRENIAWYGPFVMNTREELIQAFQDYHAGKMGVIPAKRAEG
ncbi:MAG: pirin family protein [SAR202 cluster bacterium]|nr:pirin family protein [SAR202 cluster bacterium]